MFKKLHNFFFALLSFFIISCNFTFNDSKSTSLTVNCSKKSSREITYDEFEDGKLSIYILGDKTNHYQHLEGTVYSDYFFDDLPEDLYLIHADFYVNSILRATAEDFVIIKALKNESVTLHMEEVETRFETSKVYPDVIEDWDSLKSFIEDKDFEYNCFKLSNELTVTSSIAVERKVKLVPYDIATYIKVDDSFVDAPIFEINTVDGAELILDQIGSTDTITIDGMSKQTSKPLIVNRNILSMNGVTFQNANTTENGGAIENTGILNLKNCNFSNCEAKAGAGVYMTRGEMNISGELESSSIKTETKSKETSINEVIYIISNDNQCKLTFKDNCMPINVKIFIQNNANPIIVNEDGYEGENSSIHFNSNIDESEYSDIATLFVLIYPSAGD